MNRVGRALFLCGIAFSVCFSAACSLQKMALDQTAGILKKAMPAFEKESDFDLAAAALPGNVKVVEGFLQAGPDNPDLLEMVAMSYFSYGLIVLEDQWERAEDLSDEQDKLAKRVKNIYLRAHNYGLQLLELNNPGFTASFKKGRDALKKALKLLGTGDVTGIFLTGMPLFTAINMGRDDVKMIAQLPEARALIGRLLELDENYFHAAGHMAMGAVLGGIGKDLGGDPVKAKKHFDRAFELTKRKFLLIHWMCAKTLAVQNQDKELFKKLLDEIEKADLSIFPEQKLANVSAKRRAKRLLAQMDDLF